MSILKNFIYNRETAFKLDAEPNGGARAESYGARPLVRMSNTMIEPGDHVFDELLEGIDRGIYAKGTRGGEVDTAKGTFQFNAQEAFLIENGEITIPLKDVSLSGSTLEILKNIFATSNAYIRMEVLKIMSVLPVCDQAFLFDVLTQTNNDMSIRQQGLLALMKDKNANKKAIDILLSEFGPFAKHNKLLVENIKIIGNVNLKEAAEHLIFLSKKSSFWSRSVGNAAAEVLKGWEHEKR